jgi:hypothetical protein
MKDEMIPAARDTLPPETGEDFKHHSTMPPFASDARVRDLEDKHSEVMATLGELRGLIVKLTDGVMELNDDRRRNSQRLTMLAARVALLDGEEEGEINGHAANGS